MNAEVRLGGMAMACLGSFDHRLADLSVTLAAE